MFCVLFLEINHLSIMRYPPYLKAEIYIYHKKINKKVKFQWKFLIVKRKKISKILPPNPEKSEFFSTLNELFIKKIPASGGSAPRNPWFIECIFILFILCSRSKLCLHRDEKCANFFIKFSNFFATFNFKFSYYC